MQCRKAGLAFSLYRKTWVPTKVRVKNGLASEGVFPGFKYSPSSLVYRNPALHFPSCECCL